MEQSNQSKRVLLSVIGVAILVVAVVGVSFAFFNYTRTGSVNTVKTGHIFFDSSNTSFTIDDLFPIAAATAENASASVNEQVVVGTVTIRGKTTYDAGMDYRVTAQDVNLNVNYTVPNPEYVEGTSDPSTATLTQTALLPISVYVTETNTTGISNHHVYSYNAGTSTTILPNNALLASGHIDATTESAADIEHTITIKAYIDSSRVAITDTPEENATWRGDRTVYSTAQWNALHENATPASFKIRVEAIQTNGSYNFTTAPVNTGAAEDYTRS